MLIDIHAHHLHTEPGQKQFLTLDASLRPDFRTLLQSYGEDIFLSVGIHPYHALRWDLNEIPDLMDVFLDHRVQMIGEIGLDKVSSVSLNTQKLVFDAQIHMAEEVQKPVILHVVHAMSEILEIKRTHQAIPAWIIHGFRGGKQEAEQYINKGFYLSFGPKFNIAGLLACPVDRLFLETDNSGLALKLVYELVAEALQCSIETLDNQIENNFRSVFSA